MIKFLLIIYLIVAAGVFATMIGESCCEEEETNAFISAIIWPILLPIVLVKFIIWLVWNSLKRIKEVICG